MANLRLTVLYVISLRFTLLSETIKRGGESRIDGLTQTPTTIACLGVSSLLTVNIIEGKQYVALIDCCATRSFIPLRGDIILHSKPKIIESQAYSQTAYVDKANCSDYLVELSISLAEFKEANRHAICVGMEDQSKILGADLLLGIPELKKLDISVVVYENKEDMCGTKCEVCTQNLLNENSLQQEPIEEAELTNLQKQVDELNEAIKSIQLNEECGESYSPDLPRRSRRIASTEYRRKAGSSFEMTRTK